MAKNISEDFWGQLGKKHARKGAVKFQLKEFIDPAAIPRPPKEFGKEAEPQKLGLSWGMLGNDYYGDCVLAGACHETMLWNAIAGKRVNFREVDALRAYAAITGFDPARPETDQGTDMEEAAAYRRKVGLTDAGGQVHKVAAYLALQPGDPNDLWGASYLFRAIGVGFMFPSTAMKQFNLGKQWSIVHGATADGGHYVPGFARRNGHLMTCSWGRLQPMTLGFYEKYADEVVAYVSEEMLTNNTSPEGFDSQKLQEYLAKLGKA
jgi:hypothetical protein